MGSHSVTFHPAQVNAPRLTPVMQAGTRFTYPDGRLSWPIVDSTAPRPGVVPATFLSRVRRQLCTTMKLWGTLSKRALNQLSYSKRQGRCTRLKLYQRVPSRQVPICLFRHLMYRLAVKRIEKTNRSEKRRSDWVVRIPIAAVHINTSCVWVRFALVRVVSVRVPFLGNPQSKHVVLLIYTAYRPSKDMKQFWHKQVHARACPTIVEQTYARNSGYFTINFTKFLMTTE